MADRCGLVEEMKHSTEYEESINFWLLLCLAGSLFVLMSCSTLPGTKHPPGRVVKIVKEGEGKVLWYGTGAFIEDRAQ